MSSGFVQPEVVTPKIQRTPVNIQLASPQPPEGIVFLACAAFQLPVWANA